MLSSPRLRRGYADGRYGQLHYLEGRPAAPAAPTLVMLHQTPSSSYEYEPLIRLMAADRRVVAFDTPGYGASDPPPGPLSIAAYAEAIAEGLSALDLGRDEPVDVFGFHTGAYLAAELALQQPQAVGRVVLSGVPMRSAEECAERLASARAAPQPTEDGADLLAQAAALWRYVVTQRTPGVPLERAALLYADKSRPLHRALWAYEGVWSYPARERLPSLRQPCLFLQPHDTLLEQTREACRLTPDARLVELPELDRDIFEVGADRLAAAMRDFLTPLPRG